MNENDFLEKLIVKILYANKYYITKFTILYSLVIPVFDYKNRFFLKRDGTTDVPYYR